MSLYHSDLEQTLTIGARFHHFFPSHRTTERVRRPSVLRPSIILRYIAVLGKEGSLIECEEKTRSRNRLCEHDCQFLRPKGQEVLISETALLQVIQGDHSTCSKPPVDFKTKVPFWPGLP